MQHKLLGLHQIRYHVTIWPYDLTWNIIAFIMILAGVLLTKGKADIARSSLLRSDATNAKFLVRIERRTSCPLTAVGQTYPSLPKGVVVIILGVILLIVGFLLKIVILWTIGIIVLAVGLVFALLGAVGQGIGGRRHYW